MNQCLPVCFSSLVQHKLCSDGWLTLPPAAAEWKKNEFSSRLNFFQTTTSRRLPDNKLINKFVNYQQKAWSLVTNWHLFHTGINSDKKTANNNALPSFGKIFNSKVQFLFYEIIIKMNILFSFSENAGYLLYTEYWIGELFYVFQRWEYCYQQ